jgi:hypothetical protein
VKVWFLEKHRKRASTDEKASHEIKGEGKGEVGVESVDLEDHPESMVFGRKMKGGFGKNKGNQKRRGGM